MCLCMRRKSRGKVRRKVYKSTGMGGENECWDGMERQLGRGRNKEAK